MVLNQYLVKFFIPMGILYTYQVSSSPDILKGFFTAMAVDFCIVISLILLSSLLRKPLKMDGVEHASVIYNNCGGLILSIIGGVLGEDCAVYALAYIAVNNILMWTHGKMLVCNRNTMSARDFYTNPVLYAIIVGGFGFVLNIRWPSVINSALSIGGTMQGPMGMMVVGMIMGELDLKKSLVKKRTWLISFVRLILLPVPVILLLKLINPLGDIYNGYKISVAIVMAASTPSANSIVQIAQFYGGDSDYASEINIVSTVLCILTMPLMVMLFEL